MESGSFSGMLASYATTVGNYGLLLTILFSNPFMSFLEYGNQNGLLWSANFSDIIPLIGLSYAVSAALVAFSFYYFSKRMEM